MTTRHPLAIPANCPPQEIAAGIFSDATAARSFSYSLQMKWAVISMPLLFIFMALRVPVHLQEMPPTGRVILIGGGVTILSILIPFVVQIFRPGFVVSRSGFSYGIQLPFMFRSVQWAQVVGLTPESVTSVAATPVERLKIVYRNDAGEIGEILVNSALYSQGDQLTALLKQIIPLKQSGQSTREFFHLRDLPAGGLIYQNYRFTPQGMTLPSGMLIPWESVTSIKTDPQVIAGYGATTIEYKLNAATVFTRLAATTGEGYRDSVNYLISSARNATIDPSMAKITNYPISEAKADYLAIVLMLVGILLSIAGVVVLSFYPPTVASTWLYPLLLVPLGLVPFAVTLKLLTGRFIGIKSTARLKIGAAAGFNAGVLTSVAILFTLSPASFTWLLADSCAIIGRLDRAEAYYRRIEPQLASNEDFIFTLGQFYFKKQDWETASRYYIRAYHKDPTNWMPLPLSRIPESLSRAGRRDEALAWCDTILTRYSDRKDVVRVIQKVKDDLSTRAR